MSVFQQELENMVRWDARIAPFYEVYYLKCNVIALQRSIWLRYTVLAPRRDLGQASVAVWAMVFDDRNPARHVAVKETFAAEQVTIDRDIFYFQIGENAIYNNGARGAVNSGGHKVSWDLQFVPNEESLKLYPQSFYYLPFPKTKFLAPNGSIRIFGEVKVDGQVYHIEAAPGCQAHLWGSKHAERWAWAHCNTFAEDPAAVFEAITAQVSLGKKLSRPLTSFLLHLGDGRKLTFNRLSQLLFNQSHYNLEAWDLSGRRGHYRVKAVIQNNPQACIGVTYTDPDGSKRYCYHAEAADFKIEIYEGRGSKDRLLQVLTSSHAGAFEVAERAPLPGMVLHL